MHQVSAERHTALQCGMKAVDVMRMSLPAGNTGGSMGPHRLRDGLLQLLSAVGFPVQQLHNVQTIAPRHNPE